MTEEQSIMREAFELALAKAGEHPFPDHLPDRTWARDAWALGIHEGRAERAMEEADREHGPRIVVAFESGFCVVPDEQRRKYL